MGRVSNKNTYKCVLGCPAVGNVNVKYDIVIIHKVVNKCLGELIAGLAKSSLLINESIKSLQ